jgi:hypothetical protein
MRLHQISDHLCSGRSVSLVERGSADSHPLTAANRNCSVTDKTGSVGRRAVNWMSRAFGNGPVRLRVPWVQARWDRLVAARWAHRVGHGKNGAGEPLQRVREQFVKWRWRRCCSGPVDR